MPDHQPVVTIRPAQPDDAGPLAALAELTFRQAFASDNTPADIDRHCAATCGVDIQHAEIIDPCQSTLLACADSQLVGFSQLGVCQPPTALGYLRPVEIRRFYLENSWHGRGLAQRLMQAVLSQAQHLSADGIWLGVWENNPRAIAFYKKFGFEVVGSKSFLLGADLQHDLVMARVL